MSSAEYVVLRLATMADAVVIAQFNQAMALETESKQLSPSVVAAGVTALIADGTRGFYSLAERHGEIVGGLLITFEWSDWRNADFWWIQSVYVRPDARRQGVFAKLYRDVEARARQAHACGLRLYVEHDNQAAMATYLQLGMHDAHYRVLERSFQ